MTTNYSAVYESGAYKHFVLDNHHWRFDREFAWGWIKSREECVDLEGNVVSTAVVWALVSSPDPEMVADVLRDKVVKQIPAPVAELSPVGPGVVNLGMWLAVAEQGPYSVTARPSSTMWVRADAAVASTTFDMGNGDVVTCDGFGDPIPASKYDSIDPSPVCGYTYESKGSRQITATVTWTVTWSSSTGASGTLDPITTARWFDYQVDEIQTVGH